MIGRDVAPITQAYTENTNLFPVDAASKGLKTKEFSYRTFESAGGEVYTTRASNPICTTYKQPIPKQNKHRHAQNETSRSQNLNHNKGAETKKTKTMATNKFNCKVIQENKK